MRRRLSLADLVVFSIVMVLAPTSGSDAQTTDDLFNEAVLHRIDIAVHSDDWDSLRENFTKDDYYPCDLTWNGVTIRNVGMRSRGLGSRNSAKPGLEIDFAHYSTQGRLLGLKSLVLDNLTTDPSMIRERVAMAFFRRFGVPAPREVHARLFVNGAYAGLYAAVEPVDMTFAKRAVEPGTGTLFEYRWVQPFKAEYLGPDLELYRPLFEPRSDRNHSIFDLYDPIRELFWAVSYAPDFEGTVGALIDLDSTLRVIAAETFLAERDGILGYDGMNNFYLYRSGTTGRHRLLPWDKDNTFYQWDYPIMAGGGTDNRMMIRLMADPALRGQYFGLLTEAVQAAVDDDWLAREIALDYEQIREAALADSVKPFSHEEFEAAVAELQEFARARTSFVTDDVQREQQAR
jgi:spore coat protein CotH